MADKPSNGSDSAAARAMNCLPTLQQNTLRKIFDRPEFSPAEVAALGYRRLQQAEGIGQKGLQAISAWLQAHGCELKPQTPEGQRLPGKTRRNVEQAVRLLQAHGYRIQQAGEESGG